MPTGRETMSTRLPAPRRLGHPTLSTTIRSRRRCTAAATLASADRSVMVEVSLLEARDGGPPRVRVTTRDRRPQVVALTVGQHDPSCVEIELPESR